MQRESYYRELADRARRLSTMVGDPDMITFLRQIAGDYDHIAADLDSGSTGALSGLAGIYTFLYITLRQQDYALLMGAIGLLFFYNEKKKKTPADVTH